MQPKNHDKYGCDGLVGVPVFGRNEIIVEFRKLYFKVDVIIDIKEDDERLWIMEKFQRLLQRLAVISEEIIYQIEVNIGGSNTDYIN